MANQGPSGFIRGSAAEKNPALFRAGKEVCIHLFLAQPPRRRLRLQEFENVFRRVTRLSGGS